MTRLQKMSPAMAEAYSYALADVQCWFRGFKAAKPDAGFPPGLDCLRDLKITLDDHSADREVD